MPASGIAGPGRGPTNSHSKNKEPDGLEGEASGSPMNSEVSSVVGSSRAVICTYSLSPWFLSDSESPPQPWWSPRTCAASSSGASECKGWTIPSRRLRVDAIRVPDDKVSPYPFTILCL